MKNIFIPLSLCIFLLVAFSACKEQNSTKVESEKEHAHEGDDHELEDTEDEHAHEGEEHEEELLLSQNQVDALEISVDSLKKRSMSGLIQVNGSMGVPPQNEAVVTSYVGANIISINAIEGDKVRKGQVLAYISHPALIRMQTDYITLVNQLKVLEQNHVRQKKLYDAKVGSGKNYQEAEASFLSAKSEVKGVESQLQLMGFSVGSLKKGVIAQRAPLMSPISGFVEKVMVKSGQYIQPQTPVFEIVNTEHIHLDLMVFEKDVAKIKNGQEVRFKIESFDNEEMTAKIYAIGKSFEEGPKALHVHAEILNKQENLIPGMYVNAEIVTDGAMEWALPESAIYQDGDHYYIFQATKEKEGTWTFEPKEILVKFVSNGYTAFALKDSIESGALVAQSGAYFLMAEMKKSEAEHSH